MLWRAFPSENSYSFSGGLNVRWCAASPQIAAFSGAICRVSISVNLQPYSRRSRVQYVIEWRYMIQSFFYLFGICVQFDFSAFFLYLPNVSTVFTKNFDKAIMFQPNLMAPSAAQRMPVSRFASSSGILACPNACKIEHSTNVPNFSGKGTRFRGRPNELKNKPN